MSGEALLRTQGLTRAYGGLVAVDGVDIEVRPGEVLSLIGPNGAGKTTLFHLISGAVKPSAGKVFLDGRDVTGTPLERMAALGVVRTFQITSLFPALSVRDNVLTGAYLHDRRRFPGALLRSRGHAAQTAALEQSVGQTLGFVGLDGFADQPAQALSYGQQRWLEIAIAVAARPRVILLDEPAAGMNAEEGQKLVSLIRKLREGGMTVVLVEHHMRIVMSVSDRIVVLDHGRKIAEGPPKEIAAHPEVVRVYLGREPAHA